MELDNQLNSKQYKFLKSQKFSSNADKLCDYWLDSLEYYCDVELRVELRNTVSYLETLKGGFDNVKKRFNEYNGEESPEVKEELYDLQLEMKEYYDEIEITEVQMSLLIGLLKRRK